MRLCLVGGIFDRNENLRAKHAWTPETVLLDGFRKAGVDVRALGHAYFEPSDDYDVVHVHHFGKAAMQMAAASARARFVFTGHDGPIVTGFERSRLRRAAFRYVVSKADAFVALSEAEANYFRGIAHKVHVIPNGIPADVFQLRTHAAAPVESQSNLLYVGQLIGCKGIDVLFQAVAKLRREWSVRLRLVYHNARLKAGLLQRAQELGIVDAVEFVGTLGPVELAEEYRRADLLVLPTLADCLPSVVTEALLCGTPVVASAVCGVPEQVGDYGRLVPPNDAAALADAVASVLRERPRFRALAGAMRDYAARKYNPEAMVAGHLALYNKLLVSEMPRAHGTGWVDPVARLAVRAYWAGRGPVRS